MSSATLTMSHLPLNLKKVSNKNANKKEVGSGVGKHIFGANLYLKWYILWLLYIYSYYIFRVIYIYIYLCLCEYISIYMQLFAVVALNTIHQGYTLSFKSALDCFCRPTLMGNIARFFIVIYHCKTITLLQDKTDCTGWQ